MYKQKPEPIEVKVKGAKRGKQSAGLLMYDSKGPERKYLLVHPGGPIFAKKNEGTWSIPKGEYEDADDILEVAKKEMYIETGVEAKGPFIDLGYIKQKAGKIVHAWAFEGTFDGTIYCNTLIEIQWKGKKIKYPEVDKGDMFTRKQCRKYLNPAQMDFIERLEKVLDAK